MKTDKNSTFYWFPKINDIGVPIPATHCIGIPTDTLWLWIDSGVPCKGGLYEEILGDALSIGFPLFMRTDFVSSKHNWLDTCYVKREEDLPIHIFRVLEDTALSGDTPGNGLVFREFIEMNWAFKAFKGLPISKERRYFVRDGKVQCHHPYWIPEAIEEGYHHYPPPENWRELLAELNKETEAEIEHLTGLAAIVAQAMPEYWSVDFCQGRDGKWWLIDCALGDDSWHPADCPVANERQGRGEENADLRNQGNI